MRAASSFSAPKPVSDPSDPDARASLLPPTGHFQNGAHLYPVRIYFEDTDAGGVVYHANYLRFMERARSDMLRLLGIDQRGNLDAGAGVYAVTKVSLEYRAPAKLDDALLIESRAEAVRGASCILAQSIWRGQQELVRGRITVAYLTAQGRPQRQPAHWIEAFEHIAHSSAQAILQARDAQI